MIRANRLLLGFLLLAGVFALVEIALFFRSLQDTSKGFQTALLEVGATVAQVRLAAAELQVQADEQLARLRDPRNSKAIDAGLQAAAVLNGTLKDVNRLLIPRAMKTLDGLAESTASLNRMIQATDKSVNADLAPEAVRSLQATTKTLTVLTDSLQEGSGQINQALGTVNRLLSDPSLADSQQEVLAILKHADEVSLQIAEASKQMPSIAASLERIARTSGRYQRFVILSQILSAVGRAFF